MLTRVFLLKLAFELTTREFVHEYTGHGYIFMVYDVSITFNLLEAAISENREKCFEDVCTPLYVDEKI